MKELKDINLRLIEIMEGKGHLTWVKMVLDIPKFQRADFDATEEEIAKVNFLNKKIEKANDIAREYWFSWDKATKQWYQIIEPNSYYSLRTNKKFLDHLFALGVDYRTTEYFFQEAKGKEKIKVLHDDLELMKMGKR